MGECNFWHTCYGWDRFHCNCGFELCTAHYLNHIKNKNISIQQHKAFDKQQVLKNLDIIRKPEIENFLNKIDREIEQNKNLKPFEAQK